MCNSNKRQMHQRNIFRTPPDYTALAIKYKEFRQVCKLELTGKIVIDYKNECVLRALTRVLLQEYFKLEVNFAPGSLVPTLPLRLNYILWLEDVLGKLQVDEQQKPVQGIDIGCGSSCIYSLLAAKKNSWHMSALESNAINLAYAQTNVQHNNLTHLIKIFTQTSSDVVFKDFFGTLESGDSTKVFNFCLCNPPFYDSTLPDPFHGNTRNATKRAPPHNCHTGHADELACVGGEVQFVQRIIAESLLFPQRVRIFTSMLGHKSSLSKIIEFLEDHKIRNYCTTEFCQGNTTRWGVAWSFINDLV